MRRGNSPYSAAITGGGFLFEETDALLPLLKSPDRKALVKDELVNNRIGSVSLSVSEASSLKPVDLR